MSIARELYLEGIPSAELEAELLHRAIVKTDAALVRAHATVLALHRKRARQEHERNRQQARRHPSPKSHSSHL